MMKTDALIEALRKVGTPLCKEAADAIIILRARANNAEQNLLGAHKEIEKLKGAVGHPKDDGAGG